MNKNVNIKKLNKEWKKITGCERACTVTYEMFETNDDDWLWCFHCERFFQAKDLKIDTTCGELQACAFEKCDGEGFLIDIFRWDDWPSQNPELKKHWPKSIEELKKGMHCSLYPEEK